MINPNHIKEIKAKYFNKIKALTEESFNRFDSSEERYYQIKDYLAKADKEISEYKERKRKSKKCD